MKILYVLSLLILCFGQSTKSQDSQPNYHDICSRLTDIIKERGDSFSWVAEYHKKNVDFAGNMALDVDLIHPMFDGIEAFSLESCSGHASVNQGNQHDIQMTIKVDPQIRLKAVLEWDGYQNIDPFKGHGSMKAVGLNSMKVRLEFVFNKETGSTKNKSGKGPVILGDPINFNVKLDCSIGDFDQRIKILCPRVEKFMNNDKNGVQRQWNQNIALQLQFLLHQEKL